MDWVHMGLACRSEANADRFFVDVLGLAKSGPKTLSGAVAEDLFGRATDLLMVKYTGDELQFEVFIDPDRVQSNDPIIHACLRVENRDDFLTRCEANSVDVIRVPKGEAVLTFIRDYDGNLYEIQSM